MVRWKMHAIGIEQGHRKSLKRPAWQVFTEFVDRLTQDKENILSFSHAEGCFNNVKQHDLT